MLNIEANVHYIPRVKVVCPADGVHVAGKDGCVKGVHSLWFRDCGHDRLVPKGATCFYWQLDDESGLRVGFSFGWFSALSRKVVEHDYGIMCKAYSMAIAPKPYGLTKVALRLKYYEGDKMVADIDCEAHAIIVQNVDYPEAAWQQYAEGHPYDWGCVNHPNHNPDGFKFFRKMVKPVTKRLGLDTSLKLGDIVWSQKEMRWYLVDCGK